MHSVDIPLPNILSNCKIRTPLRVFSRQKLPSAQTLLSSTMTGLPTKDIRTLTNEQRCYKNAREKFQYSNFRATIASPRNDEAPKRNRPLRTTVQYVTPPPYLSLFPSAHPFQRYGTNERMMRIGSAFEDDADIGYV